MTQKHIEDEAMNRRDFFRTCGRYGALGALAVVGAFSMRKKKNPAKGNQSCVEPRRPCGGCPVLADCGVPRALIAKQR